MLRLNLKKTICYLSLLYPVLYLACNMMSDKISRVLVQGTLILLLLATVTRHLKIGELLAVCYIAITTGLFALRFGIQTVMHLDFYGFVFCLFLFVIYAREDYKEELDNLLLDEKLTEKILLIYYLLIVVSIFTNHGLRRSDEWGGSIPYLYGPFEVPHNLGYTQIVMYCVASIQFHKTCNRKFLMYMIISGVCVAWSGVRSALLAFALVVFIDFIKSRNSPNKLIITCIGILAGMYLVFFTNILVKIPFVKKTLVALANGNITNSRTMFNSYLWGRFVHDMSIVEKIFGISIEGIRHFMYLKFANELHAHNDIYNVLLGMGIIGLISFLVLLVDMSKRYSGWPMALIVIFILLYTNGLFMYVGFTPCVPIVYLFIEHLKSENRNCARD